MNLAIRSPSVVVRTARPVRMYVDRRYSAGMSFDSYKLVLYRQDGGWVAEIPSIAGCYALMPSRDEALAELQHVFDLIDDEYREQGKELPADTTEIVNA